MLVIISDETAFLINFNGDSHQQQFSLILLIILTFTRWIVTEFGTDICGCQMINANDFVDPLTFPLVLPLVPHLSFCVQCLNYFKDYHEICLTHSHPPQDDFNNFGDSFAFHKAPSSGQNCTLFVDQIPADEITFPSSSAVVPVYC